MAHNILIVDDEPQIHKFIRISLFAEELEYLGAYSMATAYEIFDAQAVDVIVLDLGLPDGDGASFLQKIRQRSKVPCLILTARDEEEEKIRLLEVGANDYLSKPFGIGELIARIKVLIRDLPVSAETVTDELQAGHIRMKKSTNQVWLDGREIDLTHKEFACLEILLSNKNKLVKHTDLITLVWGDTHQDDTHYSRIIIRQLRKKLGDSADNQSIIKTEPGIGYRLICEPHK
ncbi:response regulator transcription factor [Shewanella sp. YIC-542]|uniref:response regulator transcription factor n=1 Tax=Shewanella mytili TaxID=3377111 RepID=UPI00398E696D